MCTLQEPDFAVYEGFAHLPERDVPLGYRIALPSGAVSVVDSGPTNSVAEVEAELRRTGAALLRAATKSEAASGQALPRKVVRWRG